MKIEALKGTLSPEEVTDEIYRAAIAKAVRSSVLMPGTLNEPQNVRLKDGFKTACWSYKSPSHNIFVGNRLFSKDSLLPGLPLEEKQVYIQNHYHHEEAHGLYTERDMVAVNKALKSISAPFHLFNLAEDAVIEHRYRADTGYVFRWLDFEQMGFTARPEALLFGLIQAEGDAERVEVELARATKDGRVPADVSALLAEMFPRVLWYYQKMVAIRQSLGLIPLLNAWLREYGTPPPQQPPPGGPGGNGAGMEDMELSVEMALNPNLLEEFLEDSSELEEPTSSKECELGGRKKRVPDEEEDLSALAQKGEVLGRSERKVDMVRADALATRFMTLFKKAPRKESSRTPTKRISARHMASGRSPYRRTILHGKEVREVYLEFDCSGSMSGYHTEEGKVLVTALSQLAKAGYVRGHLVLSAVVDGIPCWETYAFPLAQSVINRISGFAGGEGLEYAMAANVPLMKSADFVFIYTDAQIGDKAIDRSKWHAKGIHTWGLYAGQDDGDVLPAMLTFFDKAILRDSAEELVDAVLSQAK